MAFRDDREALRFQVGELEHEIAELEKEREEVRAKVQGLEQQIETEAKRKPGTRRVTPIILISLIITLGAVGLIMFGTGSSGAEMFFGDVTAVTGTAPVPEGTPCTVFVHPVNDSDSSYDAKLDILCGGTLVYGGGSYGYMECDDNGGWITRCSDTDYTPDGGDPKLEFDRRAGSIHVEDVSPSWTLDIELRPRPATPAEQG